jgi:putative transposase
MQYDTGEHCGLEPRYHIVWSTKHRHKMLTGAVCLRVRDSLRQDCRETEVNILRGELSSDHVQMFGSVTPKIAFSESGAR